MIKEIQNFDKVYGEQIYPADGMVYTIEKANVIKTYSEPELLYYFEVKNGYAKYQIAIFADNKNQHNIAGVYKTGEQGPLFMDNAMHSIHFKNKEFFKTYVVTLINEALKH
jgi:hypothetical protein